jgi:hypothetical protein
VEALRNSSGQNEEGAATPLTVVGRGREGHTESVAKTVLGNDRIR